MSTTLLANNSGVYIPSRPETRERPFCTHCKRPRHTAENCYQVHGYPDKQNGNTSQNFRRYRPYNQTRSHLRRDNGNFNRNYNGNRQISKSNNTNNVENQKESLEHQWTENENFEDHNIYRWPIWEWTSEWEMSQQYKKQTKHHNYKWTINDASG